MIHSTSSSTQRNFQPARSRSRRTNTFQPEFAAARVAVFEKALRFQAGFW